MQHEHDMKTSFFEVEKSLSDDILTGLKDKEYEKALDAANKALEKTPNHRGAVMCKALVFISQKELVKFLRIVCSEQLL